MPKEAKSSLSKIRDFVSRHPKEFMTSARGELYCTLCATIVVHDRKSTVDKHRRSAKHQKALSSTVQQRQQPIDSTNIGWDNFVGKVTSAFLSADIPLYKLRNPEMQSLFQFLGRKAPSESACRKRVDDMGKCEVDRVCEILLDKIIFMVIDESEISGCKYLNTLVGNIEVPETTYLLHCKILCTSPNQQTIVHAVDDAIRTLQANRNNFVLMLTDAARYMTAAGRLVKGIYPKLFHITCTAHALHNAVRWSEK